MMKRAVIGVIGLLLIASGSYGIVLFEREREQEQQANQARIEAEQQRAEEERLRAESYMAQLEAEKAKASEAESRLQAEEARQLEEERARRKQEEERLAKRVQEESERYRHYQAGGGKDRKQASAGSQGGSSRSHATTRTEAGRQPEPKRSPEPRSDVTVLRFEFDPLRSRELDLAHVHAGDRVSVRIQRSDEIDLDLFMGLAAHSPMSDSPRHLGYEAPPRRSWARTLTVTRLKDVDHFSIEPDRDLGRAVAKAIESPEGVILRLKAERAARYAPLRPIGPRRSPYRVEVTIETANPWNIKPRRLI